MKAGEDEPFPEQPSAVPEPEMPPHIFDSLLEQEQGKQHSIIAQDNNFAKDLSETTIGSELQLSEPAFSDTMARVAEGELDKEEAVMALETFPTEEIAQNQKAALFEAEGLQTGELDQESSRQYSLEGIAYYKGCL